MDKNVGVPLEPNFPEDVTCEEVPMHGSKLKSPRSPQVTHRVRIRRNAKSNAQVLPNALSKWTMD